MRRSKARFDWDDPANLKNYQERVYSKQSQMKGDLQIDVDLIINFFTRLQLMYEVHEISWH